MNILTSYINFKKKNIYKYSRILIPNTNPYIDKILNSYIDTYINTFYYHKLETIDVFNPSFSTIVKELEGKKLELIYELEENENKIKNKNIITILYSVVISMIKLDIVENTMSKDLLREKIKEIIKNYKYTDEMVDNLTNAILENRSKETKFLKNLMNDEFKLKYSLYRNQRNKYFIELDTNIKQLKNYSNLIINKNLNINYINVFKTTINLINIDILYKIMNSEELDYYFVNLPANLLDQKEKLLKILEDIDNENVREHIVLIVDYNYYLNHKKILNLIDIKYSFAALVDMSHIKDIDTKLETVENVKIFDYVIVDKVKTKDYESINRYTSSLGKEIFVNEFNKESL